MNLHSLPPPGATVSATPTARMKTYGPSPVAQQTRHARRIYIGGIPPNYTDEDGLRSFINQVVAQGLGEENDHSYVLSVYINHKKCFAFVELKSIELATACLELDGIIFRNIVLRILRANEYKPELVPVHLNRTIHFDLSHFQFGTPNSPAQYSSLDTEEFLPEQRSLDSIIDYSGHYSLEEGCIAIVGFPFDDSFRRPVQRGMGCAHAPKSLRTCLRRLKFGSIENPEFDLTLSQMKIVDAGDIVSGKSAEETKANLSMCVSELLLRGALPFVVGGGNDLSYPSAAGLLNICGNRVAAVCISPQLDIRILEDMRFCTLPNAMAFPTCDGRYAHFGAQVMHR
jgi:hypothetical protein